MITTGAIPTVTPLDTNNLTSCVPMEKVMAMLPNLVLKTDAIKLGLCCFIAGMITMWIYDEIGKRWK